MIFEQWNMIGAEVPRHTLAGNGSVEHAAQGDAIDIAGMHAEADDASGELVHHDEYPMGAQQNGLTAKQIDTPQAIFHVTDESEP